MAEVWQTIEQAAVTLGLSVRTVNRHITGGKLQSRLFEGRREVLVSVTSEDESTKKVRREASARPTQADALVAEVTQSAQHERQPSEHTSAQPGVNFTIGASATAASSDASSVDHGYAAAAGPVYESVRRAMSAADADQKPLDFRTMLTLADSADDKASLAVAAYQTLARASELQVQSLRRTALGAWAAVGVLATGAIIAVGWGTYRLTSAEGTSAYLRTQVTEQKAEISQLAGERDKAQQQLTQLQIESARLQDRLAHLTDTRSVAEIASFALKAIRSADLAQDGGGATTQPTSPGTQPSTQPTSRPASLVVGTAPLTQPASKPAMTGQRPTYITNSREPFDPR